MPEDKDLVHDLIEHPEDAVCLAEVWEPGFFDRFIRHVLAVVDSDPTRSLPMLDIGHRIVTNRCQNVLVWGLKASAFRALKQPGRALTLMETPFLLAGSCLPCQADLLRRRGKVHAVLGDRERAFSDAEESVALYKSLQGQPDHDLDGNGLAMSLVDRGDIRQYFGSQAGDSEVLSAAVADITAGLDITVPTVSPVLYRTALFNLSVTLYLTGKRTDLLAAEEHLRKARNLFRGPTKPSQERGKVAWATGMVRHELGGYQPCRIREMLEFSRSDFLSINLIAEACAVASDLAKIEFPNRNRIRTNMTETSHQISDWINIDAEGRQQFKPFVARMEEIGDITFRKGLRVFEDLRRSIEELREACGPKMLACLVSWPAR